MDSKANFTQKVKRWVEECNTEGSSTIYKAVNGLKAIVSGNLTFAAECSGSRNCGEDMLKIMEQQDVSFDDEERQWAANTLTKLSKEFPKDVYGSLKYQVDHMESEKLDEYLTELRDVLGCTAVDDFLLLCRAIKQQNLKIVFMTCTFWGGGIIPMLDNRISLLHSVGIDIEWHMLWVPDCEFYETCKSIHNNLIGIKHNSKPKWDVYDRANAENAELYSELRNREKGRIVFFYDDPQPVGQPLSKDDIGVLHIDTCGTKSPCGADIWSHLSNHWKKGKAFLHQPGFGGAEPLSNGRSLAPGIDVLCPKNMPRSKEQALENIKKESIRDDNEREPMIDEEYTRWMCIGRPDASKGQILALLGFLEYLQTDNKAVLWFFLQFTHSDWYALVQYYMIKMLVEDSPERYNELENDMRNALANTCEDDPLLLQVISKVHKKVMSKCPQGVKLSERVQLFTNLSNLIGDFATLANAHMVFSTREGYNLVVSEMARHHLPVLATNYVAFQDRVLDGERGGWYIATPDYLLQTDQTKQLQDYEADKDDIVNITKDIASRMNYIRENPKEAKSVAATLDKWVLCEGHSLRYHMDRLAVVLADEVDMKGNSSSQIRKNVLERLKQKRRQSL